MSVITVGGLEFEPYIPEETIRKTVREVGARIHQDYKDLKCIRTLLSQRTSSSWAF